MLSLRAKPGQGLSEFHTISAAAEKELLLHGLSPRITQRADLLRPPGSTRKPEGSDRPTPSAGKKPSREVRDGWRVQNREVQTCYFGLAAGGLLDEGARVAGGVLLPPATGFAAS